MVTTQLIVMPWGTHPTHQVSDPKKSPNISGSLILKSGFHRHHVLRTIYIYNIHVLYVYNIIYIYNIHLCDKWGSLQAWTSSKTWISSTCGCFIGHLSGWTTNGQSSDLAAIYSSWLVHIRIPIWLAKYRCFKLAIPNSTRTGDMPN